MAVYLVCADSLIVLTQPILSVAFVRRHTLNLDDYCFLRVRFRHLYLM